MLGVVGVCGKNVYFDPKNPLFWRDITIKGVKLRPLIIIVLQGVRPKEQSQHLIIKKEIAFIYLHYYNYSINK